MDEVLNYSGVVLSKSLSGILWFLQETWLVLSWIFAFPIIVLNKSIRWVRKRRYDPEKTVCPACGFRGDNGTDRKSVTVRFVRTFGPEKAALKFTCFRCSCEFYTAQMFLPIDKWLPKEAITKDEKVKEAAKRTVL